jgi:hypothetical protein
MVIGITINNILRDHITQLKRVYYIVTDETAIEPINPFDLEASFPNKQSTEIIQEFKVESDNEPSTELILNELDENFNVYDFIYKEASFEIFGRSEESIDGLIRILKEWEKKWKVKFVLLNKESPRSKCATLFFLSKNGFDLDTVYFPTKDKDFWTNIDVLITDNPKILKCKPKNKTSIKIINDFNLDIKSDFSIIKLDNNTKEIKNIIKTIKEKIK